MAKRTDIATRVRTRIKARLEELKMTARELAIAAKPDATTHGELDVWMSGVLNGTMPLRLIYLDAVADKLRLSPADLVRRDEDTVRELTPTEMALLRYFHEWPPEIQRRWLDVLRHFAKTQPDPEMAAITERIRMHPPSLRRPVMAWLTQLLEEGIPVERLRPGSTPPVGGADESGQGAADAEDLLAPMRRSANLRKQRAAQYRRSAGQK